jgi:hypothetical protein
MRTVVAVPAPTFKSAFHPKVWLFRYDGEAGRTEPVFTLCVQSRNLTASKDWDITVTMSGVMSSAKSTTNQPLIDFLGQLQTHAHRAQKHKLLQTAINDLSRVHFGPIPGFTERWQFLFQWPQHKEWVLLDPARYRELIAISPFLGKTVITLKALASVPKFTLVTGPKDLATIERVKDLGKRTYIMAETPEGAWNTADYRPDRLGLHAKIYFGLRKNSDDVDVFLGSANLTDAAFRRRNCEAMVHLMCDLRHLRRFESEFIFQNAKKQILHPWLQTYDSLVAAQGKPVNELDRSQELLELVRCRISQGLFTLRFLKGRQQAVLSFAGEKRVLLSDDVGAEFRMAGAGATFPLRPALSGKQQVFDAPADERTEFLIINLTHGDRELRFITIASSDLNRSARSKKALNQVVTSSDTFFQLLGLMLGSAIVPGSSGGSPGKRSDARKRKRGRKSSRPSISRQAFLEPLLLNGLLEPERQEEIERAVEAFLGGRHPAPRKKWWLSSISSLTSTALPLTPSATVAKPSFHPYEFQTCTAAWAIERLFGTNREPANRALIADEVGLGKTIVTKQVCDYLRTRHPRREIQIVYMTSSLDICSQNKKKLAHSHDELVTADRITLLHAFKRSGKTSRVTIFSMTPGTSIHIANLAGNITERLYIAWLAQKLFRFGTAQACRVFALDARVGFKKRFNPDTFQVYQRLPREYWRALKPTWRNVTVGGRKASDVIRDRRIDAKTARLLVKELRKKLVEVLLERFSPDLIILDEFQRFQKELLGVNEHGGLKDPLAARLLKRSTPTLLLSATPYRLWDSGVLTKPNELPHHEDLQRIFEFLFDARKAADELMRKLDRFGQMLLGLNEQTVQDFCEHKQCVETAMNQVMARTERVHFLQKDSAVTLERFMSESSELIDFEELYEYLALSSASRSRRTLLSYWKSGASLLSFMHGYATRDQWTADRKARHDANLWVRFGQAKPKNIKLRYLLRDVFGEDGENLSYLWIPPTSAYYAGHGIFHPTVLRTRSVKKALVFSTWKFVPRMIAAEVSHRRQFRFRRVKARTNPLRATPVTWARFYFPSPFLAGALSHADFVNAGSYEALLAMATTNIRRALEGLGIAVGRGGKAKPWQVLRYVDFLGKNDLRAPLDAYRKEYAQGSAKSARRGRSFEERYVQGWEDYTAKPMVTNNTISALAKIAIASPSVCLLRALETLHGKIVRPSEEWRALLEHCIHDIRNYLNRAANQQAIVTSFPRGSYHTRVEAYFTAGNYQALLDEYLALCDVGSARGPVRDSMEILRTVMAGSAGSVTVPGSARGKRLHVTTDIAVAFGEVNDASSSRESARVGFNSPFWPMVLATTSIGQEGLDFHLYCKDVYHWNLPNNPVAFEQREGRINRFNALMVRKNLVANQPLPDVRQDEHLWVRYFEEAPKYCMPNDRYNLGLSPHWIYTPKTATRETAFQRHIMDVRHSNDRAQYDLLMADLTNYRLALGQPDQAGFLKKVRDNRYLAAADLRGLTLNLFPAEFREKAFSRALADEFQLKTLLQDARVYLASASARYSRKRQLRAAVERSVSRLNEFLIASPQRKVALGQKATHVAATLHYLLDPHDKQNDRIPTIGFDDDLEVLRAGTQHWHENRRSVRRAQ